MTTFSECPSSLPTSGLVEKNLRLWSYTFREALLTRAIFCVGVAIYLLLFKWMYREMIAPGWGYLGFSYEAPSFMASFIGWVGSLIPLLWMPITLRRPSQAIYWLLYLTVYIPSMLVPYYLNRQPVSELALVSAYFLAGFIVINLSFWVPLPTPIRVELRQTQFWLVFWIVYATLTVVFLHAFGSTLRLVSFADRYDLRFATRHIEAGVAAEYSRSWLAFCFNPFLLALGLLRKRLPLFLIGAAGGVLLYSSAATRVWLVGIIYIPILSFALKGRINGRSFGMRMILFTSIVFIVSALLHLTEFTLASAIWEPFVLRNHMNSGVLTGYYADFFSQNPLTYGSQVTGVDLFVKYPYAMPIQFIMGDYIAGSAEISDNAHVWADGIASFGPSGVLVLSILLAGVFYVLDFCCQHLEPIKAALLISVHYANFSNVALATSLLGGGVVISIALLMLMPSSLLKARTSIDNRSRFSKQPLIRIRGGSRKRIASFSNPVRVPQL